MNIMERAHKILAERGPMRGSDLGWALWGDTTKAPGRGTGSHANNKFCRPAGKIIKRLERMGKAYSKPTKTYTLWVAIGNTVCSSPPCSKSAQNEIPDSIRICNKNV